MARHSNPSFEAAGLVLSPALLLILLAPHASAQLTNLPDLNTNTGTANTGTTTNRATGTTQNTNTRATQQTTTARGTTQTGTQTGTTQRTTDQTSMTGTAPSTSITNAPSLSTGGSSVFHISDLPTIAGVGIPTQAVPWTAGAAFMQKSSYPEGTVFICVGAILGFLGIAVLAWRGLVAWSLHRSVQRTAYFSQQKNEKATLVKPRPSRVSRVASYGVGNGNTMSMDHLAKPFAAGSRPTSYVDGHKPNPRDSNLFFSPTAGAGVHAHAGGDRRPASGYMPAGFYATSSVNIPSNTQLNAPYPPSSSHTHLPSLAGRPASQTGYPRPHSYAPSPPGTPTTRTADAGYPRTANSSVVGGVGSAMDSASTLNLNAPGGNAAGGRAPSAYLEDLFENHGTGPRERY